MEFCTEEKNTLTGIIDVAMVGAVYRKGSLMSYLILMEWY